jgi:histidyl-tRNA synthetase
MVLSIPETSVNPRATAPAVYIAYIGDEARRHSFALARRLRAAGVSLVVDLEGRKLKKSLAVANSLGSRFALIVGDDEIKTGAYVLRDMASGEQRDLRETELIEYLKER